MHIHLFQFNSLMSWAEGHAPQKAHILKLPPLLTEHKLLWKTSYYKRNDSVHTFMKVSPFFYFDLRPTSLNSLQNCHFSWTDHRTFLHLVDSGTLTWPQLAFHPQPWFYLRLWALVTCCSLPDGFDWSLSTGPEKHRKPHKKTDSNRVKITHTFTWKVQERKIKSSKIVRNRNSQIGQEGDVLDWLTDRLSVH